MKMNRYAVCLFQDEARIDNNSQFLVKFALSPEQALAQALRVDSLDGIKHAGHMEGIDFYEYQGKEHIVKLLPQGI